MAAAESTNNAGSKQPTPAEERKKRLAEALRKNLRLRKARERAGGADAETNATIAMDEPESGK